MRFIAIMKNFESVYLYSYNIAWPYFLAEQLPPQAYSTTQEFDPKVPLLLDATKFIEKESSQGAEARKIDISCEFREFMSYSLVRNNIPALKWL